MFGVEEKKTANRIVLERLIELDVPIYQGKYILMEELLKSIQGNCQSTYVPRGDRGKRFKEKYEAT